MDTIKKSRYPRMNRIFQKPKKYDLRVMEKNYKLWSKIVIHKIKSKFNYK